MLNVQRPSLELVNSYLEMQEAFQRCGEPVWESNLPRKDESQADFIDRLLRSETQPEIGMVEEVSFWAAIGLKVVGRIALRLKLNEHLKVFGGHIGYEVHPDFRKQGIAKNMLKFVLKTNEALAIQRLLLTCSPDNLASNRTIISCGGRLEKTETVASRNRMTNYYWINLAETTNYGSN